MKELDARGLSCPEPVVMIRKAMTSGENAYQMVVDNVTAKENVTRYATALGYKVDTEEGKGSWKLRILK